MSFDYYLGANTAKGFVSHFQAFTDEVARLYILKGGPGCGKSTTMKRIADKCEKAGVEVQRIWCASDADSLDGVYIPAVDTMYVDGTAPHVLEPNCPGARDGIINFGAYWNQQMLADIRGDIVRINEKISRFYANAYKYLSAAALIFGIHRKKALENAEVEKISRRVRRIISQYVPHRRNVPRGQKIDVFFSVLSKDGPFFLDIFADYAICELYDTTGIYGLATELVMQAALQSGYTVYAGHDPLFPDSAPLHVVVPELRFALLTSGQSFGCPPTGRRRIRLDMLTGGNETLSEAACKKADMLQYKSLLQSASHELEKAKDCHDELEALYRPAIDYREIDRVCQEHFQEILQSCGK